MRQNLLYQTLFAVNRMGGGVGGGGREIEVIMPADRYSYACLMKWCRLLTWKERSLPSDPVYSSLLTLYTVSTNPVPTLQYPCRGGGGGGMGWVVGITSRYSFDPVNSPLSLHISGVTIFKSRAHPLVPRAHPFDPIPSLFNPCPPFWSHAQPF